MARLDRRYVSVVGTGSEAAETSLPEELGRLLAREGAIVVCGGLGGVMAAACRGAKAEGGLTVGLLPSSRRHDANPWVDVAVPTGLGEGRNLLVAHAGDVMVAVAGEYGTLSEIAFALKLGKPVVGLHTWELSQAGVPVAAITSVASPMEAVDQAVRLVRLVDR